MWNPIECCILCLFAVFAVTISIDFDAGPPPKPLPPPPPAPLITAKDVLNYESKLQMDCARAIHLELSTRMKLKNLPQSPFDVSVFSVEFKHLNNCGMEACLNHLVQLMSDEQVKLTWREKGWDAYSLYFKPK